MPYSVMKKKNRGNMSTKLSTSRRVTRNNSKEIKIERPQKITKAILVHHQTPITRPQRRDIAIRGTFLLKTEKLRSTHRKVFAPILFLAFDRKMILFFLFSLWLCSSLSFSFSFFSSDFQICVVGFLIKHYFTRACWI